MEKFVRLTGVAAPLPMAIAAYGRLTVGFMAFLPLVGTAASGHMATRFSGFSGKPQRRHFV